MIRYLLFATVLLLFAACNQDLILDEKRIVNSDEWVQKEALSFDFVINNTQQSYNLTLRLAHSPEFRFQNIYTTINTLYPNGEELSDTVSFQLTNKYGQWVGKCSQSECVIPIALQQNIHFPQEGEYSIQIAQYSRLDTLQGIHSLELLLAKTKE